MQKRPVVGKIRMKCGSRRRTTRLDPVWLAPSQVGVVQVCLREEVDLLGDLRREGVHAAQCPATLEFSGEVGLSRRSARDDLGKQLACLLRGQVAHPSILVGSWVSRTLTSTSRCSSSPVS